MPSVISKFLERTEKSLNVNRTALAGAVLAATLTAYGAKIAYPLINDLYATNKQIPTNLVVNNTPNNNNNIKTTNQQVTTVTNHKNGNRRSKKPYIPALNIRFILQMIKLARIMIPSLFCREMALLSTHTTCLFVRTFLSIYVANLEGAIVKFMVRKDATNFIRQMVKWFAVAVPATCTNSLIRYLESKIALSFRSRLVEHSYQLYFRNQSYYRVTVLDGRLDNCAQRLTDDIETVASTVSHLYGQITKPMLDIVLMAFALGRLVKSRNFSLLTGPIVITGVVMITALILRIVSPRFGHLVALEAEKKGNLRNVHSRIVTNAEEIAFYGGHKVEQTNLRRAYVLLCEHLEHMFGVRLWFIMLEQFLMKYIWSGTGMIVVSLPILLASDPLSSATRTTSHLSNGTNQDSVAERTHYFTTAKNLLITGSSAVERLMSSYKDIVELAGHTGRVANMFTVLEEASRGIYQKTTVENRNTPDKPPSTEFSLEYRSNGTPIARGVFTVSPYIRLCNVPIVTPNCDVVCAALSFELHPGQHLIITGPNGCGKSSLFRILSGLWPVYGGEICTPQRNHPSSMFYIPQKPYMALGCLRDQIIYPDTCTDMINKQVNEADLIALMEMVRLEYLIERDGLYVTKDWQDVLSGGEKQRLAIARLFYHKPKYALLDECTSAVSADLEMTVYKTAMDMGITLLTITHKATVWEYHNYILQFDGNGGWEFRKHNFQERLTLKSEKELLKMHSNQTETTRQRLDEINRILGESD